MLFQDHLSDEGIKFEASPQYEHSMHGVIERVMQEINKLIRSVIYEVTRQRISGVSRPKTWHIHKTESQVQHYHGDRVTAKAKSFLYTCTTVYICLKVTMLPISDIISLGLPE
jgi:hypothetical protein